jgi:type IV pilus assembly protein PilO
LKDKFNNLTVGQALLIGLALAAIYYFNLYNNGSALEASIQSATQEYNKNVSQIEDIKRSIVDAERFQKTVLTLGAEMQKILMAVPEKLTSVDLMRTISTEAKKVGAEIGNITTGTSTLNSGNAESRKYYEPIAIQIDLTGKYTQIMQFLAGLTKLDKIVTIESIRMNASTRGGESSSPQIAFNASLQAYKYISPEGDKSKTASPAGTNSAGGE